MSEVVSTFVPVHKGERSVGRLLGYRRVRFVGPLDTLAVASSEIDLGG